MGVRQNIHLGAAVGCRKPPHARLKPWQPLPGRSVGAAQAPHIFTTLAGARAGELFFGGGTPIGPTPIDEQLAEFKMKRCI